MQRSLVSVLLVLTIALVSAGQTHTTPTQNGLSQSADDVSKRLDELQRGLDEQSQNIKMLQQHVQERDSEIQELRQLLSHVQAPEVDAPHSSARASAGSSVANPASEEHTTNTSLSDIAQRMSNLEQPKSIHFKAVTLTPGGFLDATG